MSINHYENFPVASFLLPKRLRPAVKAIYHFARSADDIADEGDTTALERLTELDRYAAYLDEIELGVIPEHPIFSPLAREIRKHRLPIQPFRDLLTAFSQDVEKNRYADLSELMAYCRHSANPVGRLMLHLYGEHDAKYLSYSDAICTALQLINFLQDIALDYSRGRIYLPRDELAAHYVTDLQIARGDSGGLWHAFMHTQIERARKLLHAGAPLGRQLRGRIGLELRMTIIGGDMILRKLHADPACVFQQRPVLGRRDWVVMLGRALI